MKCLNRKALLLVLAFATASISPVLQAGWTDKITGAWTQVRGKATELGTSAWGYTQTAFGKQGTTQDKLKVGGVVAALVAVPVITYFLVKKLKNTKQPKNS